MAQIAEIVDKERQRTTLAECHTVTLYCKGGFMHAYVFCQSFVVPMVLFLFAEFCNAGNKFRYFLP